MHRLIEIAPSDLSNFIVVKPNPDESKPDVVTIDIAKAAAAFALGQLRSFTLWETNGEGGETVRECHVEIYNPVPALVALARAQGLFRPSRLDVNIAGVVEHHAGPSLEHLRKAMADPDVAKLADELFGKLERGEDPDAEDDDA